MSKGISDIYISTHITQMQLRLFLIKNIIETGTARMTQRDGRWHGSRRLQQLYGSWPF